MATKSVTDTEPAAAETVDPRVTKKRVTMKNFVAVDENTVQVHSAVDYVREDFLAEYIAARQGLYRTIEVSDEYDAGPGGYDGQTHVPADLDHPLAGQTFAATTPEEG